MKKHASKALSKKIMLSLMVAGVMSSYAAGVAGAAEVIKESYIAPGPVALEQILVSNSTVELMHGGTVSHEMQSGDLEERTVLITGKQGSLTAKDVTFFGDMRAMEGASITLNGGTIIAGPYYEFDGTRDGNTEVGAFDTGSTINLNGVDIKCFVNAQDGGKVIVTNSDISTGEGEGIGAEHGGKIEISGANNTYYADYILADDNGSIKVNSGKVQLEQVLVSGGSTVELLGGGTVEHAFTQEEPEMVRVEGAGSSLTAKDVDFAGYVEAMDGASITLNGGSVLAGPGYGDVYATGEGSSITATNTDFTGDVYAADGASVTLNGGSVTAVVSFDGGGVPEFAYNTALFAEGEGATLTATDVDIKSGVFASWGGKVTIIDSDITKTDDEILADRANSSIVISSSDGSNVYAVEKISVDEGGSVTINSGKVQAEQVLVTNGGKVELLGGGSVESIEKDPYSGNYQAIEANGNSTVVGENLQIKGDVSASDGSTITLTGGSVIGVPGENNLGEIAANSGTIEFNNVDIQSNIIARKYDSEQIGKVIVNNSNIIANEGLCVEDGSIIELNGGADNTYKIVKVEGEELSGYYLLAEGSGKIYINGGTLEADNLRSLTHGIYIEEDGSYIDSADGGIVLAGDGKISTMTDQIFDTAAYDAAKDTVTDGENVKVDNTAIDYQGGTLIFNDAKYTLEYLANAKSALLNYQSQEQESFASNTVISMKGELVGTDGKELTNTTVDAITSVLGEGTVLEKVTVTAGQNLLVGTVVSSGTEVAKIEIGHSVECGFGAADLHLGIGSDGVVITNGSKVTLVGKGDGEDIIKVLDGTTGEAVAKAVQVIVGTAEKISEDIKQHGILNIGSEGAENKLTGSVTVNAGSTLNATGQTTITGSVTLNGANLNVNGELNANINVGGTSTINGSVTAKNIKAAEESTTNIIGKVIADKLEAAKNSVINIGNKDKAGSAIFKNALLNGASIFLDPSFKDVEEVESIEGSSKLAVVDAKELNGHYAAGQNSVISFGVNNIDAADNMFAKTDLKWKNDVTAAAYVADNTSVAKGSIVVDGSLNTAPDAQIGDATFADNSLLMVNGEAIKVGESVESATAAISDVQTLTVGETAKLYIDGAENNGVYKIIAGDDTYVWADANIITSNALIKFTGDTEKDGQFIVKAALNDTRTVYDNKVVMPDVVDKALSDYATSSAAAFFNAAVSDKVNTTKAQQIDALNNAAAMSELAGVSHATYSASNILTNAVADHMSLAKGLEHDTDIWAHYVHTKENIDGLAAANSGAVYDAQYNGIVVGADLYKHGKGTIGAALTYIDGKVTGSTKNEAEYYGLSIYGGVQNEDSAVIGDISYLHGKNEITQNNSGYTLTGAPKSDAFSVGVRAEQSFKAGAGKVVPYAGLRYMHLGTGNYTNSIGLSYDADDANLFLLPVGVKYSAEHKSAGWTLRPIVEVGYVWAMGDRDGQQTVSLNGTSNGFGYDVMDSGSYIGRFVLEAEKANVTYGLGYEYQKGDSVKANKWMVNLNWNF